MREEYLAMEVGANRSRRWRDRGSRAVVALAVIALVAMAGILAVKSPRLAEGLGFVLAVLSAVYQVVDANGSGPNRGARKSDHGKGETHV